MGILDIFRKQPGGVVPLMGEAPDVTEQLVSLMEMMGEQGLAERIEDSIQKNFVDTSSYFQAFEAADTGGNYFGEEFNIRATAGRIKASYAKEPWMYATANLIARTMSLVPFKVVNVQSGEPDPVHPLNQKLNSGNNFQDPQSLRFCGYLDLILGGNYFHVFDEYFNSAMLAPVELTMLNLNPKTRTIDSLKLWDTRLGTFGSKTIPYNQVVHMKLPNPYSPFYGLSFYIGASRPLIMDRAKNEFDLAFYLRGATNAGIIETTDDINRKRMARLMRTFEAVYTGKRNWWRTIFLPKGAKWVRSGLTMTEMQHLDGMRENRLTFLASIGVPPSKVGIVQDVNRATSEVQDENFWVNTIKPLIEVVASSWNNSYLVKTIYSGAVRVEPDFSGIEALNGSLVSQGEQAKAIENYFFIDEIRKMVFKQEPAPNGRGQIYVAELRASAAGASLVGGAPVAAPTGAALPEPTIDAASALGLKEVSVSSQNRIERKLTNSFLKGYNKYHDDFMVLVSRALTEHIDVRQYVKENQKAMAKTYIGEVENDLVLAMERGFSSANAQVKDLRPKIKKYRFNQTDQEAIDALKSREEGERRTQLVRRSIENFVGFNDTDTDRIMKIIDQGLADGKTNEQIAADLRAQYDETYSGQSSTIARTEILSAVSEGTKWNHDVLKTVFTDVQKQWFHVAPDKGSREEHIEFEGIGPVASDFKWGGVLDYPRDPSAGPDQTINCRCTMVSVIPDNATSNADVILDQ